MTAAVLFVDRDGTLIEEPPDEQVDRIDKIRFMPGVVPALLRLQTAGYQLVMVSNQDGLGTASFPQEDFDAPQQFMLAVFESQGIYFDDILICPHLPEEGCDCRKPATGLLAPFLARTAIDVNRSAVIGDRDTDLALAKNVGLRGIRIGTGADALDWPAIADELCLQPRRARVRRRTNETDISVDVSLDTTAPVSIATGIGFFDHMLEQIARHGGYALSIRCQGDLHIDDHHSVEDVALALGEALRSALGDKRGIARYGFTVPMDEARAEVLIDLSGRPVSRFSGEFGRDQVGGLSIEMVRHFFTSLAVSLGAAIHVTVTGDNAHHMVEGCFKALGRALAQATRRDGEAIPSSKGSL
ncbi:MAG: bifunctional histidinol-phosphatase/imidazoleglycerol-phosphate dehydratase HisB [Pseudomonadota bacterium]